MKSPLLFSILFTLFVSFSPLFAQNINDGITVSSKGGSFDYFSPWGEGSLGVVSTQYYAFIPKSRKFQYFNKSGELEWNVKVKPFNFNNFFVLNIDSDYCYYINSSFNTTSLLEKSSRELFLTIYRFDKKGTLVEKELSFDNPELAPMKPYIKGMYQSYVGAYDRGFISVSTNDQKHYHIVQVDEEFNVTYNMVELLWDQKIYNESLLSKPIYCLDNKQFCVIQTVLGENKINATVYSFDLDNFKGSNQQKHSLNIEGINLIADASYYGHSLYSSSNMRNEERHQIVRYSTNATTYTPSLGAYTDYTLRDGKLICTGIYKNKSDAGFVVFEIDQSDEDEEAITPKHILAFEADTDTKKCEIVYLNSGEYVYVNAVNKGNVYLKTSTGTSVKYAAKTSNRQALINFILGSNEQLIDLNRIYQYGNGYIFTNESKRKKATIYRN